MELEHGELTGELHVHCFLMLSYFVSGVSHEETCLDPSYEP